MKGNNTLMLNIATVKEALQEYLDKRTIGFTLLVNGVTYCSTSHTFKVKVAEKPHITDTSIGPGDE